MSSDSGPASGFASSLILAHNLMTAKIWCSPKPDFDFKSDLGADSDLMLKSDAHPKSDPHPRSDADKKLIMDELAF